MPEKKSTSTSVVDNGPSGIHLGRASYQAQQAWDAVIIFAFGWHPTPGYTDFFEESPIDVFPPQFIFRSIPPSVIVPQVLTPFAIWVMFGASEPIKTVTVHDADGSHEITVQPMSKALAASRERATWVAGSVVRGGGGILGRATTLDIGEESQTFRSTHTTMAVGEEDQTTLAVGEENPTTQAVGEEGGPTTLAVGEETTVAVRNSPFGTF